jgi:hypothetical protein
MADLSSTDDEFENPKDNVQEDFNPEDIDSFLTDLAQDGKDLDLDLDFPSPNAIETEVIFTHI